MRAGICTIQQTLTPEATTILKQAVTLARRRGHAQVTPLHVASAMLASSTGLLRRACLQSHSHPLQCKALELCFNVALNRLPASSSSPLLGPHSTPHPSLSNALVAAFKRAQAHQRRGSIENQQQPILALKIEVEQLIISILDDPSVSRVMREAGFSSPQVKSRVEQAVSLEITSQSNNPNQSKESVKPLGPSSTTTPPSNNNNRSLSLQFGHNPSALALGKSPSVHTTKASEDDIMSALESLVNKRRNTVIIGESLSSAESVVRGVMEKFERSGNISNHNLIPQELRCVQFISLTLQSLRNFSREEVERRIVELRNFVKSYVGRGIVFYLGDLNAVSEFWSSYVENRKSYYCSLEHLIMEIKKLVCGIIGEFKRVWLLGIATFRTYLKCKSGQPSLEHIWELHPLTIPAESLSLSLNLTSDLESEGKAKVVKDYGLSCSQFESGNDKKISCFSETANSATSNLPPWLQQYKNEKTGDTVQNNQIECLNNGKDLSKKWNSFSITGNKQPFFPDKVLKFASTPSSPTSYNSNFHESNLSWPALIEFRPSSPKEHQFWIRESSFDKDDDDNNNNNAGRLNMFVIPDDDDDDDDDPKTEPTEVKPELLSNPNSSPNSASSSEVLEDINHLAPSFRELNPENFKTLCDGLEMKVPWQKDIIPEIVNTVLQCRSGTRTRSDMSLRINEKREDTWFLFLGDDSKAKEMVARELAKLIYGSHNNFLAIGSSKITSPKKDNPMEECSRKRSRAESQAAYEERLSEAMNENPHRVFFLKDFDQVECCTQTWLKKTIERGKILFPDGDEDVPLRDAIIILSCKKLNCMSRACSPTSKRQRVGGNEESNENEDNPEVTKASVALDLNMTIEDDDKEDETSAGSCKILELVDAKIVFNMH